MAIGLQAGFTNQGANSIAIGAFSGSGQPANSIVINSTGTSLVGVANGTCIAPFNVATRSGNLLIYDTSTREITTSSSNTSALNKTFVIDHPLDNDKYLVHYCLEGPEVGVYYRGESKIENDKYVEIELPHYVSKLAKKFSIQVTPIIEDEEDYDLEISKTYYVSRVKNNTFKVFGKNGNFFWLLHGIRVDNPIVEPNKSDVIFKNVGPYTWLEN